MLNWAPQNAPNRSATACPGWNLVHTNIFFSWKEKFITQKLKNLVDCTEVSKCYSLFFNLVINKLSQVQPGKNGFPYLELFLFSLELPVKQWSVTDISWTHHSNPSTVQIHDFEFSVASRFLKKFIHTDVINTAYSSMHPLWNNTVLWF